MSTKKIAIEEGLRDAAAGPIESYQCKMCDEWKYYDGYAHPGVCEVCEKKYPCSYCDPFGALRAALGRIREEKCSWKEKWTRSFQAYWDSDVAKWITWCPPGDDFQYETESFIAVLDQEIEREMER